MRPLAALLLALPLLARADWTRVDDVDAGATGNLVALGSTVVVYGYQGGNVARRTSDGGASWTDVGAALPEVVSRIYAWEGALYLSSLGTVYVSHDLGDSWQPRGSVEVTGNGALIGFASSGGALYAHSNRKSIFRSEDAGAGWDEILIEDERNLVMTDFEVVGDLLAAEFAGLGAMVSTDGGASWAEFNPPTACAALAGDGLSIFGLTWGAPLYRLEPGAEEWVDSSAGLPAGLRVQTAVEPAPGGLVLHDCDLIGGAPHLYVSGDHGANWSALDVAGLPSPYALGGAHFVAGDGERLFYYNYAALNPDVTGVYASEPLSAVAEPARRPAAAELAGAWPNPFNPHTRLVFELAAPGRARLAVHDLGGREVARLVEGVLPAGRHEARFGGGALASGLYLATLETEGGTSQIKLLLVK